MFIVELFFKGAITEREASYMLQCTTFKKIKTHLLVGVRLDFLGSIGKADAFRYGSQYYFPLSP
jgi:hypothetical protein